MPLPFDPKPLEGYPLLYFTAIVLIIAFGAYNIWRGKNDGKRNSPTSTSEFFLDGPLIAALKGLERIATAIERSPTDLIDRQNFRDDIGRRVSEAKGRLFQEIERKGDEVEAALGAIRREFKEDFDQLEKRVREVELQIARMTGRRR